MIGRTGRAVIRGAAAAVAVAGGAYAASAALAWYRFGRADLTRRVDTDPLLDAFVPRYDVVERHHRRVRAPAAIALAAARQQNLRHSMPIRTIFRVRELAMRASPDDRSRPHALLDEMRSLGWGVLADVPGQEVVLGAVTRPWEADVTFRAVPAQQFASFDEPDYVKIAWTLRVEPLADAECVVHTETRAVATDAAARARFRRYWALVSPGVALIRRASLRLVRQDAERRAGLARAGSDD